MTSNQSSLPGKQTRTDGPLGGRFYALFICGGGRKNRRHPRSDTDGRHTLGTARVRPSRRGGQRRPQRLEHLFGLRAPQPIDGQTVQDANIKPGVISGIPLFSPEWTALPGFSHEIRVDAPNYVHMFERLLAASAESGEPAVFGHLQVPKASQEEDAVPGFSQALRPSAEPKRPPSVGVVMEIVRSRRLDDGGLTIVAHGICRFHALRPRSAGVFSRADLVLLPDQEEISEVRDWPDSVQVPAHLRAEATRAAAAEVSYMWAQAEAEGARRQPAGGERRRARRPRRRQRAGRRRPRRTATWTAASRTLRACSDGPRRSTCSSRSRG